jgi:hypothetical protein
MKNLLLLFFAFAGSALFAQTDYKKIPLNTAEECRTAEPAVLVAADLVLSKYLDEPSSFLARDFVYQWVTKTEYTFTLNSRIWKISKKENKGLYWIYYVCLAKYLLEHKDKASDGRAINIGGFELLADYISDPAHRVKITKPVQELLDAKKNGKMGDFVDGK